MRPARISLSWRDGRRQVVFYNLPAQRRRVAFVDAWTAVLALVLAVALVAWLRRAGGA